MREIGEELIEMVVVLVGVISVAIMLVAAAYYLWLEVLR